MPRPLLDRIVALTGAQDRDSFEASLFFTVWDLLAPSRLVLHRLCGDPRAPLLQRALAREGDSVSGALASRVRERAVRLVDRPHLAAACASAEPLVLASEGVEIHVVRSGHRTQSLLEIERSGRLGRLRRTQVNALLTLAGNYLQLLDESERDVLTGLRNRRTFDRHFQREARDEGQGRRYLGAIDVDHFKSVNDRFGHLYGDEVLILVARLMQGCFRHTDGLYRFGGEEFITLIDCPDGETAGRVLDRFRRAIAGFDFPQVGRVTVSIGYTEIEPGEVPAATIARADDALYYAKEHGRDRVDWHEALVAAGELRRPDEDRAGDVELF